MNKMAKVNTETINTRAELNSRQWKLHDYLKVQEDFIPYKVICLDLGYATETTYKANTGGYRLLVDDVQVIRLSDVVNRIPISNRNLGLMYAKTEKEAMVYIKKLHSNGVAKLEIASKLKKKLSLDGQRKLKISKYEKEVVESVLR